MLNECYNLLQALKTAGIELPSYQQGIVSPGKNTGPCLRIRLRQDSSISSIEALTDEEWSGLWTIMEGNQNSRPVIRLTVPLLNVPIRDSWWTSIGYADSEKRVNVSDIDKLNALKTALNNEAWAQSFTITNGNKDLRVKTQAQKASDLWARVQDKSKEVSILLKDYNELADVQRVFERIAILPDMQQFATYLRLAISEQLETGNIPIEILEAFLVGKLKRAKNNEWERSAIKLQLAFDVESGTIYRKKTKTAMEAALEFRHSNQQDNSSTNESFNKCAYGSDGLLQTGRFPNPRIPIVGEKGMPLVSMFSDAPANTRYRLTDSAIVPVGQLLASQMAEALLWITSDERKGKTWRSIASGLFEKSREKKDLLISYVDGKPDIDAPVADFFGTDQDSLKKQFEVDSKTVCDALNAVVQELPSSVLRVFVLRQVSQGQVQIVLSREIDPRRIIEGSRLWNEGAANLPSIIIPLPYEKDKAPEEGRPFTPYPEQVVRLLSLQWIRGGAKKDKQDPFTNVAGPSLGSIIDLLVREPYKYKGVAHDLLHRSLVQICPLLVGLTGAIRTYKKERSEQYPLTNRLQALIACSTIGLMLHALNSRKEEYMQNSVFAVGKMLALADDIHRSYCEVVRDGGIPPSLLGNSLLSTAMENPARAITMLGDRLRIYIGWVKTAQEPQGTDEKEEKKLIAIRTARKRLDQYGLMAELVARQGLPAKMDDLAKAHLMLGYLASTKEN